MNKAIGKDAEQYFPQKKDEIQDRRRKKMNILDRIDRTARNNGQDRQNGIGQNEPGSVRQLSRDARSAIHRIMIEEIQCEKDESNENFEREKGYADDRNADNVVHDIHQTDSDRRRRRKQQPVHAVRAQRKEHTLRRRLAAHGGCPRKIYKIEQGRKDHLHGEKEHRPNKQSEQNAAHHIAELQLDTELLLEELGHGRLLVGSRGGVGYVEGGDTADDV